MARCVTLVPPPLHHVISRHSKHDGDRFWRRTTVHYVTRTGRVLEALPIMMQLRADGVVVGRGFDASGAFVLSGTYHPPSHTEPQVRRRRRQHVHDKLTCSTMLLQVSFRFSKRYTDVAEQQGLASTHGAAAASSFGVGVDGSALQLHASIDGTLSTHTHSAPSAATPSPHIVSLTHCAGHVAHVGYSRVPFEGIWGVWEIRSSRASHFQLEHGGVVRLYPRVAGYTKQRYYHPACLRLPASTSTTTATTTTTATATTTTT